MSEQAAVDTGHVDAQFLRCSIGVHGAWEPQQRAVAV
jgi:hypothetical protein